MTAVDCRKKAYELIGLKSLTLLAALSALILPPDTARAATAAECYDTANTQTIGQPGWTGCEGMYIVKDKADLLAGRANGHKFTVAATFYTFADGPNRIFTGQMTNMITVFRKTNRLQRRHRLLGHVECDNHACDVRRRGSLQPGYRELGHLEGDNHVGDIHRRSKLQPGHRELGHIKGDQYVADVL